MNNYSVSIIIPVYNSKDYLPCCLDSLIYESKYNNDVEIIVVDDHSDYSHQDIINMYTDKLNIKYISTEHKTNNPGMARQTGIKYAQNNYLCFIDSDDEIEGLAFYNIIEHIDVNNIDVPLIITPMLYVDMDNEENNHLIPDNVTWLLGKFIKKSFIINNNINFNSNLFTHEDLHYLTQITNILTYKDIDIYDLKETEFLFYYYKKNVSSITCQSRYLNNLPVIYEVYTTIDYLNATIIEIDNFLNQNQDIINNQNKLDYYISNMIFSIIYTYFAYQINWFRYGYYGRSYLVLKQYINIIEKYLNIPIINYIKNNAWMYFSAYSTCITLNDYFIEQESLFHFLIHINLLK